MITIGSLSSGIGGFELGLERAIPNSKTIWQCEKDKYCRSILKKHWPLAKMYTDIRDMNTDEVEKPDIICGGFPCQDISVAGKGEGIYAKKSGLWWQMFGIISDLRPRIAVLENVPAITFRGGREVLGSFASIGYDAEWTIISARQFGAPHLRRRWFLVAYSCSIGCLEHKRLKKEMEQSRFQGIQRKEIQESDMSEPTHSSSPYVTHSNSEHRKEQFYSKPIEKSRQPTQSDTQIPQRTYWEKVPPQPAIRSVDDGIPQRVAKLRALGNAIVPQCSEYIGQCIVQSGLLEDIR